MAASYINILKSSAKLYKRLDWIWLEYFISCWQNHRKKIICIKYIVQVLAHLNRYVWLKSTSDNNNKNNNNKNNNNNNGSNNKQDQMNKKSK